MPRQTLDTSKIEVDDDDRDDIIVAGKSFLIRQRADFGMRGFRRVIRLAGELHGLEVKLDALDGDNVTTKVGTCARHLRELNELRHNLTTSRRAISAQCR